MILYIVRHAHAGEHGDPRYPDDSLRPLTKEGRDRFKCLVKMLAERGFEPQCIATSPLVRCRQTAEIVAAHVAAHKSDRPSVVEMSELAPGSRLAGLISWTERQDLDRVAWVGHAPDVERLTAALIGPDEAHVHFSKGAIAAIEFDAEFGPAQGLLRWLITPKIAGCH